MAGSSARCGRVGSSFLRLLCRSDAQWAGRGAPTAGRAARFAKPPPGRESHLEAPGSRPHEQCSFRAPGGRQADTTATAPLCLRQAAPALLPRSPPQPAWGILAPCLAFSSFSGPATTVHRPLCDGQRPRTAASRGSPVPAPGRRPARAQGMSRGCPHPADPGF